MMHPVADLLLTAAPTAMTQTQGGRARALAVTGAKRSIAFPETPTFVELGYPSFTIANWYGARSANAGCSFWCMIAKL